MGQIFSSPLHGRYNYFRLTHRCLWHSGYGDIFGREWFQGKWEVHQMLGQLGFSIAWQELFAIVVACHVWENLLRDHRIKFHCDNESAVSIINTKR